MKSDSIVLKISDIMKIYYWQEDYRNPYHDRDLTITAEKISDKIIEIHVSINAEGEIYETWLKTNGRIEYNGNR